MSAPFRPISPSFNLAPSLSALQVEESVSMRPLTKWLFAVYINAFCHTSESITNLKKLSDTFPTKTFKMLSPQKHNDLISKIQAVYTSLIALAKKDTTDSKILIKASNAANALKLAFPQEIRMETPPGNKFDFCFSPVGSSVTPTKLQTLNEEESGSLNRS